MKTLFSIIALLPIALFAQSTAWYTANPDAATFEISTAADLQGLAQLVNAAAPNNFSGKTIKLTGNIALTGVWDPIGSDTRQFKGIFDGQGYIISGLSVNGVENAGLFGYVGTDGQIKNLNVVATKIKGNSVTGGLTAVYASTKPIENCGVLADSIIAFNGPGGGLVGLVYDSIYYNPEYSNVPVTTITNSFASANVVSNHFGAGGLVGHMEYASNHRNSITLAVTITDSYATGNVAASLDGYIGGGGLVGYIHSYSYGSNSRDYASGSPISFSISNSYASVNIYVSGDINVNCFSPCAAAPAGGLVGRLLGSVYGGGNITISNSFASGNINSTSGSIYHDNGAGGGLVGEVIIGDVTITDSYASGDVTVISSAGSKGGGLVGYGSGIITISNSYASGNISGNSKTNIGGILGDGSVSGTSVYYNSAGASTAVGRGSSTGISAKSAAELKTQSTFAGWDFENIWRIGKPIGNPLNDGMPYLPQQTPVGAAMIEQIQSVYTGVQIKPTPTVTLNGVKLIAGVDFDYEYGANINVGAGSVAIIGKTEEFWGKKELIFAIEKASGTCSVSMDDFTASGTTSTPVPESPTNGIGSVSYLYKNLNDDSPATAQKPANVGSYRITAVFPQTANYLECKASTEFDIHDGAYIAPVELRVVWTADSVFTYNKMVQAPMPSVEVPGIELIRLNTHSAAGIYKGADAAVARIKDEAQARNYNLANNTKNYEITKKDLKPYFKVPDTLSNFASNTDTLWAPREIFADSASLRQILDSLLSYDGFAQDTVTKAKDDISVLKNTVPAISLAYDAQTSRGMLAKRTATARTAMATINTDNVSADNYVLARRGIVIVETVDDEASPISHSPLATSQMRVWQTASGSVNLDLGYMPSGSVLLQVYNLQGKLVASEQVNSRFASIKVNAGGGVYLFRAGNRSAVRIIK